MGVTKETLQSWLTLLEEDRIGQAMVEIEKAIENPYAVFQTGSDTSFGMTFETIQVGETYKFVTNGVKKSLQGKKVKIIDKKIKNVQGILLENAGRYKIGQTFSITPSLVEKL